MGHGNTNVRIRVNLLIGCTASGKSAVALAAARQLGAELVSIDSMKIYRRMDIGTAKPTPEERRDVFHHLIDIIEPFDQYNLGRFVGDADRAIRDIASRDLPVVAEGGSMMFVRGLLSGVFDGPAADPAFRRTLRERAEREGTPALHAELAQVDPEAAQRIHANDLRRIERALEVYHLSGRPITELQTQWEQSCSQYDCRVVALRRPKEEVNRRINARVRQMMVAGLPDEVRSLLAGPGGIGQQAAQAVGYAELIRHFHGELSLDEAIEQIKIGTRRLAKSQRTWLRRIPDVRWVDATEADATETLADRVIAAWEETNHPPA